MRDDLELWIGIDSREIHACQVAGISARQNGVTPLPLTPGVAARVGYDRPVKRDNMGRLYDPISQAPMSTEFAISRFITPLLSSSRWAMFTDGDVMFRRNVYDVTEYLDPSKAVYVVKHKHKPTNTLKMDYQPQTQYSRKNWSSVMVFNCQHPANDALTLDLINTAPGRDLHAFCWLDDDLIGELPPMWNYLVGHTVLPHGQEPAIVHFTDGVPTMPGYHNVDYATEWREHLKWVTEQIQL